VGLAGEGAIIDFFAGFAVGVTAPLDLHEMLRKHVYVIGTSGSMISDMKAVLGRLEAGTLDTNISVYAISGMQGVPDALEAVNARTSGGKIVIYPQLTQLGLITLAELPARMPEVAAALDDGRWTNAAELALIEAAGLSPGSATGGQVAVARKGAGARLRGRGAAVHRPAVDVRAVELDTEPGPVGQLQPAVTQVVGDVREPPEERVSLLIETLDERVARH